MVTLVLFMWAIVALGHHTAGTPPTGANVTQLTGVEPPTESTARCDAVTFPWTGSTPTCATFGKPVSVSGVQVTASNLRVGQSDGLKNICLTAAVVNKSGQSVDSFGLWSLDSVSPQGAFHIIDNSRQSSAPATSETVSWYREVGPRAMSVSQLTHRRTPDTCY
jgi:hypothetical protein